MISAWAVGSFVLIGRFQPSPTMTPSLTTTAPTGTSPARSASRASSSARDMNATSWSLISGVEELDDAGLERVLGADDHQAFLVDELLQQCRAMSQMAHRNADGGTHRLLHDRLVVVGAVGHPQHWHLARV